MIKITCLSELFLHNLILSCFSIKDDLFLKIFLHFLCLLRVSSSDSFNLFSLFKIWIFIVEFTRLSSSLIDFECFTFDLFFWDISGFLSIINLDSRLNFLVPIFTFTSFPSISASFSMFSMFFMLCVDLFVFVIWIRSWSWMSFFMLFLTFWIITVWSPKFSNMSNELHWRILLSYKQNDENMFLTFRLYVFSFFYVIIFLLNLDFDDA